MANIRSESQSLATTVGNKQWRDENRKALRELFPETLTHIANINFLSIGYRLKLLGVDWRSQDELAECLTQFEMSGILHREQGSLLKRGKE